MVNRRQKLALLALLAITRRPISRDRLVDLFWGDRSESRARHSLSEALSQLRRVLGPQAIRARQSDIALAEHLPVEVDLRELADAAAARNWGRVLALYEGPFLDGIHVDGSPEWEHWVLAQRQGAERLFEAASRAESERLEAAEKWPALEAVANRWLLRSPLDPLAACRLLTAIARGAPSGAAALALVNAAYEGLAFRLASEHGVAPADEVASCRQRLISTLPTGGDLTPEESAPERSQLTPIATPNPSPALSATVGPSPRPPGARLYLRLAVAVAAAVIVTLTPIALRWRATSDTRSAASVQPATPQSLEARRLAAMAMSGGAPQLTRTEAIASLEQAVRLDSSLAMAHRTLALLWEGDGTRGTLVAASLTRAASLADQATPVEREAILSSYHLLVSGDYAQAAEHQRALLQLNPGDADAWHDLGMTYQYLGDHERAAEAYRQALVSDRTSAATWTNLVDALYAAGNTGAARLAIDSMAAAIPGHPSVFSMSARVLAAEGSWTAAEAQARAYLAATSARPRSQGIGEMLLSRILWSQGRVDEGDAAARRGIERQLQVADTGMALREALVLAASAFWIRNDVSRTRRRLEETLRRFPPELLPAADRPYLEVAMVEALAGLTKDAEVRIEAYMDSTSATTRRRNSGTEALARGTLALRAGEVRHAIQILQEAATVDCPACGLPELGVAYTILGKADSAQLVHRRYLAYPSLRRTDVQDALHRRRLEGSDRRYGLNQ